MNVKRWIYKKTKMSGKEKRARKKKVKKHALMFCYFNIIKQYFILEGKKVKGNPPMP